MHPRTNGTLGVVLAANTALATTIAYGASLTAGDGLEKAQQTAQTWQADATLTRVSTNVIKTDGTAIMWQYSFLSPATEACARVIMLAGSEPRLQDLGSCNPEKPVSTSFVDSPAMLKAAVNAGFQPGEESDARLMFTHDAATPDRECWVVSTISDFDRETASMRGWCVDPKNGEFVVRLSGHN
jgi:hypothetical protein